MKQTYILIAVLILVGSGAYWYYENRIMPRIRKYRPVYRYG